MNDGRRNNTFADAGVTSDTYDRGISEALMTFARTLSGELVPLDPTVIDAFSSRVAARVLVGSAAGTSRRVWNGLIDKRSAVIVRCSGVSCRPPALPASRVRRP